MALQGKCFYSHREGRTEALGRFGHVGSGNILRASLRRSVCESDRVYSSGLANLARHAARAFSYRRCLSSCSARHCGVTGTRIAGCGNSINSSSTVSINGPGAGKWRERGNAPTQLRPTSGAQVPSLESPILRGGCLDSMPASFGYKAKNPRGVWGDRVPPRARAQNPLFPLPTGPAPVG